MCEHTHTRTPSCLHSSSSTRKHEITTPASRSVPIVVNSRPINCGWSNSSSAPDDSRASTSKLLNAYIGANTSKRAHMRLPIPVSLRRPARRPCRLDRESKFSAYSPRDSLSCVPPHVVFDSIAPISHTTDDTPDSTAPNCTPFLHL
jgi:hypothetical protein